jgi:hypothetical protein
MPVSPFTAYTAKAATERLPALPPYAEELRAVLGGDLWRGGQGWIGELPTDPTALASMARGMVSENVLLELLVRHVAAILGKEPRWALTPTREAQAPASDGPQAPPDVQPPAEDVVDTRIAQVDADLTAWWDKRHMQSVMQQAAAYRASLGRGPTYVFVPPGLQEEDGTIPPLSTLVDALEYIYVDARPPESAGVYTDPRSRLMLGVLTSTEEDGTTVTELTYYDLLTGQTVLKVFRGDEEPQAFAANLGRYLFLHDRPIQPLLTSQLLQGQKSITLALSQTMRNVNLAGHRQRDYMNAQPPGEWAAASQGTPGAQKFPDGTYKVFQAAQLLQGPLVTNFIQGNDIYNEKGEKIGVTNPNVSIVDPISVDHFEKTYTMFRYAMHAQAHQLHIFGTEQAQSGISREQARADFETRLGPDAAAVDDQGRAVLTAVLGLAAALQGQPDLYADLRADFSCVINTGPLSPEEQNQIRLNVAARLASEETAMSQLGIDDVTAEQARIAADREAAMSRAPQIAPATGGTAPQQGAPPATGDA